MRIGLTEILALLGVGGAIWFFKLDEPLSQPGKDFFSWKSNQIVVENAKRLSEFSQKRWQEINGGGDLPFCDALGTLQANNGGATNSSTVPPQNILTPGGQGTPDEMQLKLMKGKQGNRIVQVAKTITPSPSPSPTTTPSPVTPQPGVNCRDRATAETQLTGQTPNQANPNPRSYTGSGARPAPPIDPKRQGDATINRYAYPEDKPYRTTPLQPKADQDWMSKGCQEQSIRGGNRLTYQEYEDHLASRRNGQRSPLANSNSPALYCISIDGQRLKYIPDWGDGTQSDLNRLSLWVSVTGGADEIDKPLLTRSL